jgi:hypothetical protein
MQESFSQTSLKRIARMSKNELITMVISISNYAEQQKAASLLLLGRLEQVNAILTEEQIKQLAPAANTEPQEGQKEVK